MEAASSVLAPPQYLPAKSYLSGNHTLRSWLLTQDHKRIAILYLLTTTFFFTIGGCMAAMIRLEFTHPGRRPAGGRYL